MGKNIIHTEIFHSPCGDLILGSIGEQLCLCDWTDSRLRDLNDRRLKRAFRAEMEAAPSPITQQAAKELYEYFAGLRKTFDMPLLLVGTSFQKSVWRALLAIHYGNTATYSRIAEEAANIRAARAVGRAVGANPIAIFVPCHRVIAADGALTGFAGGLEAKRFLLALENRGISQP